MTEPKHDASLLVQDASGPFVGRWNRLVSTTNWEKGRIIYEWRLALVSAGAPAAEYSDEAWSRKVGGVTGQHVGRLRRVYERFADVQDQYEGLYWTHFQAALDWPDAEMWLEGAIQNKWSVSEMRRRRWATLGAIADQVPRDEQIVASEVDEDFDQASDDLPPTTTATVQVVQDVKGVEPEGTEPGDVHESVARSAPPDQPPIVPLVRPFEHLGELPSDVSEAFESYKLAILHHKSAGWKEISRDDLLASLDALKALALAPSGGEPSF
jgi:hypothetical protein